MAEPKFLIDETTATKPALPLRQQGIDVTTVKREGILGSPDTEILELAKQQGRAIITEDQGFLRRNKKGEQHPGIIFLTKSLTIGKTIREIKKIWMIYTAENLKNKVIYIPIKTGELP